LARRRGKQISSDQPEQAGCLIVRIDLGNWWLLLVCVLLLTEKGEDDKTKVTDSFDSIQVS
jgi:hypothetical protein